jgi:hypothetical protein
MDDIVRRAVEGYRQINPRDLRDTEAHMSQVTLDHLTRTIGMTIDPGTALIMNTTLFGFAVRIDDSMPFGKVEFVTESAQDRALRRLAGDGYTINIMKLEALSPQVTIRETPPTLRALLRKWLKRH